MPSPSDTTSSGSKKSMLEKLMTPNSKPTPETFPELSDCIIWLRFILALIYGLVIGLQPNSRGGVNVMFAMNLVTFVPVLYATTYLGASQEAYGTKLMFGGVMQGVALVLLIWIYFYTASHADDEAILASIFNKFAPDPDGGGDATASEDSMSGGDSSESIKVEESEF